MHPTPWTASYPPELRWDSPIPLRPIQDILGQAVARFPDRPALDFMGRQLSYRELGSLVDRAVKGLQRLGVGPGVHVGLYLANTPHYVVSFFAVLEAGGVVVNYSPLDAEKVLEHKIADSETDILVTLDFQALYPQMDRMLGKTRLKTLVVGTVGEFSAAPDAVSAQLRAAKQLSDVAWDERHVAFATLLDNDGACEPHDIGDPAKALAVLQYTGGTTGTPKGAMLTHGNLSAANEQYWLTSTRSAAPLVDGQERWLAVLPPFHIYALSVNMLLPIRLGACAVLHTRFDPKAVLDDLAAKKITVFPGVPTMYTALNHFPGVEKYDLKSLKYCGSGGAPLPAEVHERFMALTGCSLGEGWGMTETSPSGTFSPIGMPQRVGSCGMPMPGITIRIGRIDDPNAYLPANQPGELLIKGPNVMAGYWKNPQASAESLNADGFFRTGDVAYLDDDGWVHIVDRTKDMLLCSGYNVYPRVIEEAIYQHPAVHEACVIGVPDEYRGQSPKAFITLKPGASAITLDELKGFLADKLGRHEMIGALEIRAELPKTPIGKLSKKTLADEEAARRAQAGA
jgi:long-chain acyl-CoA synthetase